MVNLKSFLIIFTIISATLSSERSKFYHSQDTYGNYEFAYYKQKIAGDCDYRYEKRTGSLTRGSYGFANENANLDLLFFSKPMDDDLQSINYKNPIFRFKIYANYIPSEDELQCNAHHLKSSPLIQQLIPKFHSFYDIRIPSILYGPEPGGITPNGDLFIY